jgi:hypothetical protein
VDITRRMYKTPCRFLRDSDITSTIRWVEARPDAQPLPYPSVICSRLMEPDPWLTPEVGEQRVERYGTTLEKAPIGVNGNHVCGTPEEFERGGTFEPELPPAEYDANGFLVCCEGPKKLIGGLGLGGRAAWHVGPVTPPLGNNCQTAPLLTVGAPYAVTVGPTSIRKWAAFIPTGLFGEWRVRLLNGTTHAQVDVRFWTGLCPFEVFDQQPFTSTSLCYSYFWSPAPSTPVWVTIASLTGAPLEVVFLLEAGSCSS